MRNQDIFSAPKRTHSDSLEQQLQFSGLSDQKIEQKLNKQHKTKIGQFQIFMNNHYAQFSHKINNCQLKCVQNSNSYEDITQCGLKCSKGLNKFETYINQRIQQMQVLLNECVDNARSLPNSSHETYFCFGIYIKGFNKLRQLIQQQSLYYE